MGVETGTAYDPPEVEGSEPPLEINPNLAAEGATEVPTPPPVEAAPTIRAPEPSGPTERVPEPTLATPERAPRAVESRDERREITDEDRIRYKLETLVATGLAKPEDVEKSTLEEKQALIRDRFAPKYWQKYSEPWHIEEKKFGQIAEDKAFSFFEEFFREEVAPRLTEGLTIEVVPATDFEDQRECTDRKALIRQNGKLVSTLRLQASTQQGPQVKEKMDRARRTQLRNEDEKVVPVELPTVTTILKAEKSVDPRPRRKIARRILEEVRMGMEDNPEQYGETLHFMNRALDAIRAQNPDAPGREKSRRYVRRAPRKLKSPPRVIWTRGQES